MGRSVDDAIVAFKGGMPAAALPALSSDSWVNITPDTAEQTDSATLLPLVAHVDKLFRQVDYRLEGVRLGELTVPRVLLETVPVDLATVESPAERKRLFIQLALPLVLQANEYIMADRARLIDLDQKIAATGAIAAADRAWLATLASRYGVETPDTEALLHEVRSFDRLLGSVASYMANLNTHFAYDKFRDMRADQQQSSGTMDSIALVGALDRYSERGEDYVATIRSIINSNDLRAYDKARLSDGDVVALNQPAI
jgi:Bax protein